MSANHTFEHGGKTYTCSLKAKFLVETANGTSSYTLERGFSDPIAATEFYDELAASGNKKKRLTMIDCGKRTVLSRT
jgi:hypothetical protein